MDFVSKSTEGPVVTLTLNRGKVNAINEALAEELRKSLEDILSDEWN